jgi:hypothetical protein
MDERTMVARQLLKDHPDAEKCKLYQILIGSSPEERDIYLDLPNGEIENAIRNLGSEGRA